MQESHRPALYTNNNTKEKTAKAATNFGPDSHNLKFDHFVLQGEYDNGEGRMRWEDLTADESLDAALASESNYKENEPATSYRLMSVWKYTSTGKERRYLVKRESALSLFV